MEQEPNDEIVDKDETPHPSIFEEAPKGDKGVLAEIDFDLRETGRWLLKVIGGPNNGAEFSMLPGHSYLVGTDPNSADIIFHDNSVSRQHGRITIAQDEKITIEDLGSRNGTLVDGNAIKGSQPLETNTLVSMGTTSFIIFDREGEMQTIISPLLPSIVKTLQKEDGEDQQPTEQTAAESTPEPIQVEQKPHNALGAFILIGIITGVFVVVGLSVATLFQSVPIVKEEADHTPEINAIIKNFPTIHATYNRKTGSLLVGGHVLTDIDKNQLLYTLQGLPFIKSIDSTSIIIDENVWREINLLLSKRPQWKSINVHSPKPGKFIISGYLQTRTQAEALNNYVTSNFAYVDLLTWNIIVEEDIKQQIQSELQNVGIANIRIEMDNGEVSLTGGVNKDQLQTFDSLVTKFKQIPGIRNLKNFVTESAAEESMINLTGKYQVTGYSQQGEFNLNVVINGKILSKGDVLDGMTITAIKSNTILLEKDGVRYRIDYNQ